MDDVTARVASMSISELKSTITDNGGSLDGLVEKAEMLAEYVGLGIADGRLHALPQLVGGYVPPLNGLARFVRRLAEHVDWTTEQPCFDGLARQLARCMVPRVQQQPSGRRGAALHGGTQLVRSVGVRGHHRRVAPRSV